MSDFGDIIRIPATDVRTLDWDGDELVDWRGGGRRFALDGSWSKPNVYFAYSFDAAVASPSRQYIALYKKLGTKGLIIDRTLRHVREINRSCYHAEVYEYPVALVRLFDGREVLVHCPEEYNRLEIEEIETGRRLSRSEARKPEDIFHSRLAANAAGTRLISAGWVWHPFDVVAHFDLRRAVADPATLDTSDNRFNGPAEATSAAFADDDTLLIWHAPDADDFTDEEDAAKGPCLRAGTIASYDLAAGRFISVAPVDSPVGRLMPVGREHVVGFHGHPRLIHVSSGRVVHEWPDVACGNHGSSIIHHLPPAPAIALDPVRRRFAVAQKDAIAVVTLAIP